jgi:hypothetical protein
MYKVATLVNGRTVRKVETATPMGEFFAMIQKDALSGKITNDQALTFAQTCAGARRAGYVGGVNVSTAGGRTYKIIKV